MASLATTSLRAEEHRALDRFLTSVQRGARRRPARGVAVRQPRARRAGAYKELVLPGLLPRDFHRWAKQLQGKREDVHYKCMRLTPDEASEAYAAAERFVREVEKLLGA